MERSGEILGIGALDHFEKESVEIKSVAVDRRFKRMGYGTSIVDFLIKESTKTGSKNIYLYTVTPKFFAQLGFDEIPYTMKPESLDKPIKVYNDVNHNTLYYQLLEKIYPEYLYKPIWKGEVLMKYCHRKDSKNNPGLTPNPNHI